MSVKTKAKRKHKAPRPHARTIFPDAHLAEARERHGCEKTCPRCGETKDIDDGFGWRYMKPTQEAKDVWPQGWCLVCRQAGVPK